MCVCFVSVGVGVLRGVFLSGHFQGIGLKLRNENDKYGSSYNMLEDSLGNKRGKDFGEIHLENWEMIHFDYIISLNRVGTFHYRI